jgi:hypothetical protein
MNCRLTLLSGLIALSIGLLPPAVLAQSATGPATQPAGQMSGMGMGQMSQGQAAQKDKMAESMTAMAQMCQTMMQREHATLRYALIGGCVLGVLLAIALILFIVLEIQWIRFFGVRIRAERAKLSERS